MRQRVATLERREAWRERTLNEFERDRQRVHRLKANVKPRKSADPNVDPFELAYEALRLLATIKTAIKKADQLEQLEQVAEALRRLAYGPDHPKPETAAESENLIASRALARLPDEPEHDFAGWDGSWRRVG